MLTKAALPPLRAQPPSFSSNKSGMMKSLYTGISSHS
jgi:hypothetical protein